LDTAEGVILAPGIRFNVLNPAPAPRRVFKRLLFNSVHHYPLTSVDLQNYTL
jgi:hypothetical protein